jgi:hypothetical protein
MSSGSANNLIQTNGLSSYFSVQGKILQNENSYPFCSLDNPALVYGPYGRDLFTEPVLLDTTG